MILKTLFLNDKQFMGVFEFLPARVQFCCLLVIFASSFGTDQAQQNAEPV